MELDLFAEWMHNNGLKQKELYQKRGGKKRFFFLTAALSLWYKTTLFFTKRRRELATHKSAIKRQKQAERKHEINKSVKSTLRTLAKKVEQAVAAKNTDAAKEAMAKAMKAYDKAASAGIVHKNLASRRISRLSSKIGKISAA